MRLHHVHRMVVTALLVSMACGGDEGTNEIDACAIVTQADATALFGQPAEQDTPSVVLDPALLGECKWTWADAEANSHLLQFSIWDGEQYYGPPGDAVSFDIGDQGAVNAAPAFGTDIEWIEGGRTIFLSYFTVGIAPAAEDRVEDVKALALQTSMKLP